MSMQDKTQDKVTADGMDKKVTPNKQFFMSKEEMGFLQPRFVLWQQQLLVANDLKSVMDLFVRNVLMARIGIVGEEMGKWDIDYEPMQGTFTLKPAAQRPAQPNSGIIVPKMVPPQDIDKSKN